MTSNSRLATQNNAFGSAVPPSTKAADTYSDDLMDDLFMDVDRILDGDLSGYMNVVGHKPKPANPTTRTVQLPSNFAGKSAADIYKAAIEASRQQNNNAQSAGQSAGYYGPSSYDTSSQYGSSYTTAYPSAPSAQTQVSHVVAQRTSTQAQPSRQPANSPRASYSGGGRPVTSAHRTPAQFDNQQTGNLQTNVFEASDAELYGQFMNRAKNQSVSTPVSIPTQQTETRTAAPVQTLAPYIYPDLPLPELQLSPISPRPNQTVFEPQRKESQQVSLPFLLMGAAGISAVSTLGLWTLSQSIPGNGFLLSLGQEATAAELPNSSDESFLAYLQQSLDVISAKQAQAGQTVSVIPVVNNTQTLPTTVPNTNPPSTLGALPNLPGASATPKVIERVFVPVYQGGAAKAATPAKTPVPNVSLPAINTAKPKVPVPAPVAAAAAIPPGAPANAKPSVPIVQPAAALPAPSVPIAAAPTNAAAAVSDVTPDSENVLVGVLNLGSRSAALFNIDGSSQRAYVGDRVGVSDWTLVSVNGQDVVVRRDGEVRSVYIGQRF